MHADFLARRHYEPPPLGATGFEGRPSDQEHEAVVLPAPEGGGFLHLDAHRLRWTRDAEASDELSGWDARAYGGQAAVYAKRVIVLNARGLHALRCLPAPRCTPQT